MAKERTMLVTGASGQLGSRVVDALLERGATRVVAGTRNPDRIAHLAAKGAELRQVDFDDARSLRQAFEGVDRLLLISADDLDTPGRRLRQHRTAIEAAERANVGHVVYTSAPAPAPSRAVTGDHFWTEHALASSNFGWTILRNHLYADLLLGALPQAIRTGVYVTATGSAGRNYVTRGDAARAAAGALLDGFEGQRVLDVTGPAPLTGDEVALIAEKLAGTPIRHVAVGFAELESGLLAAGLPRGLAAALVQFDRDAAQGFHAVTTSAVRTLSGREPQSVAEFLDGNAAQALRRELERV